MDYWNGLLDWTTGMDYWNGLLEWTTGMDFNYHTGLIITQYAIVLLAIFGHGKLSTAKHSRRLTS